MDRRATGTTGPLVALTATTFAVGLGELVIAGILPPVAADMHVSIPVAGQLTGVYALVFAVLTPFLAAALGGGRRKRGLLIGLSLCTLANVLAAVAPDFVLLLGARVLAAVGSAIVSPLALGTIDDVVPREQRGRAQGIVFAGFSVAMTIGVPIGALMADQLGWRWVFALIAAVSLLAAFLSIRLPEAKKAAAPKHWTLATSGLNGDVVRLLAISFISMIGQYSVFTYLRPYLAGTGGYNVDAIAIFLLLSGVFGTFGNVAGGMIGDRFGTRNAILSCLGANVLIFLVMRAAPGPFAVTAACFAIWSIASWGYGPSVNAALAQGAGDHRDVALAFNMTAFNLGIAFGSLFGGIVIATTGVANIVVLGAILIAVALTLALTVPRRIRATS